MQDVADAAGLSRALVSLVMRDSPKVSDASRAKVLAAAEQLGYRPNRMASSLASARTMTLGLVLNDLHNPFFAEVADGVHGAASAAGYRVVLNSAFAQPEGEAEAVAQFLEYRVDGLILTGPRLSSSQLLDIAAETRLAIIGTTVDTDKLDSVNNDERRGAQLAVDHLVELGHRDIAHIDGGVGAGAAGRRAGYVDAMKARGLDDLGYSIPHDISVVGYDNVALAQLRHVALSTVDQPRTLMGQLATRLLLNRLNEGASAGTHQVLAPTFIARDTSGPARG